MGQSMAYVAIIPSNNKSSVVCIDISQQSSLVKAKELFVKELSHYYGKPKYCDETKIAIMKNKKIIL